ncbi:SAM-dependent methyltransferase [Saccharopolyspora taberi]|uniref:SAM-dependent methyltransferase n=1 Tax=Saccharopolyspora taberi TaxID=60895 RepID=A0ABN3V4I0_9PSEU
MTDDPAAPRSADLRRPNAARMYDYYLGGSSNFEVDRAAADALIELIPRTREGARANRSFLARAVRFCREQGVRQFLDLGSGIPTVGNVHEIAQADDPEVRVVYVDHEPVAVAHGRRLLRDNPATMFVLADLRDTGEVLTRAAELLDFSEPVAVLMVAVLHFVPGAEAGAALAAYREAVQEGFLVLSHATVEDPSLDVDALMKTYGNTETPFCPRSREELEGLLAGCELVEPGLVYAPEWRPDIPSEHPERSGFYAAVARLTLQ